MFFKDLKLRPKLLGAGLVTDHSAAGLFSAIITI